MRPFQARKRKVDVSRMSKKGREAAAAAERARWAAKNRGLKMQNAAG
jgi:hypothetical protein